MKNIKTIEEIRIKIDKIDLEILNLIEKKPVDRVVKLKTKDQIIDQKRIENILKKLDEEAKKDAASKNDKRHLEKNDKGFY